MPPNKKSRRGALMPLSESTVRRWAKRAREATSTADLAVLATHQAARVREAVAWNNAADASTIRRLLSDVEPTVVAAAVRHPTVSISTLVDFARHEATIVRRSVAEDPRLPGDELRRLLASEDHSVVRAALHNPSLPGDTLVSFLESTASRRERYSFLTSHNLPDDALMRWVEPLDWHNDSDQYALKQLLERRTLPLRLTMTLFLTYWRERFGNELQNAEFFDARVLNLLLQLDEIPAKFLYVAMTHPAADLATLQRATSRQRFGRASVFRDSAWIAALEREIASLKMHPTPGGLLPSPVSGQTSQPYLVSSMQATALLRRVMRQCYTSSQFIASNGLDSSWLNLSALHHTGNGSRLDLFVRRETDAGSPGRRLRCLSHTEELHFPVLVIDPPLEPYLLNALVDYRSNQGGLVTSPRPTGSGGHGVFCWVEGGGTTSEVELRIVGNMALGPHQRPPYDTSPVLWWRSAASPGPGAASDR